MSRSFVAYKNQSQSVDKISIYRQLQWTFSSPNTIARLPRLLRTRSCVYWEKSHSCRFRIIKCDFLSILKMVYICVRIRIVSMRGNFNENTQYNFMLKKIEKIYLLCFLFWRYDEHSLARITPVWNIFS